LDENDSASRGAYVGYRQEDELDAKVEKLTMGYDKPLWLEPSGPLLLFSSVGIRLELERAG
jgi:hypothetical protein